MTQVYIYEEEITKRGRRKLNKKRKRHIPMNSVLELALSSSLDPEILFFYDRLIVRILKNVLRPLRRQVHIRPANGKTRDGRRGNHQRRTIFHSLR